MVTYTVERLDALSLAKILGLIGLLWGVIVAVMWLVSGLVGAGSPGFTELVVAVGGGAVYGVVVGAVTAILYNAAASLVGGMQFDLASDEG